MLKLLLPLPLLSALCAANLIPSGDAAWNAWAPRPDLKPAMSRTTLDGQPVLGIAADSFAAYGKWVAVIPGIQGGRTYRFSAAYRPRNIASEDTSIVAILSWFKDAKSTALLQRDYADVESRATEWRAVGRTLTAPQGAASLRIELALRWAPAGSVQWKQPVLVETQPAAARRVRLVTTYLRPTSPASIESNLRQMGEIIDRAAAEKPDLVVLSENVVDRYVRGELLANSQPVPGPATEMLSAKARQHKTYIATTLHEVEDGLVYNTGVLIDRSGKLVGKYRKVHLAMEEAERGITPGSDYPVFQTDFGKVGLMTCWDNWFTESARILRLRGAEILVLPIAGDGVPGHWDVISRARAIDNGVFLVASNTLGESSSRIVSPEGKVLAETLGPAGIASAEVDLDAVSRVHWLSVGSGEGDPRSLYVKERRPDTYRALQRDELDKESVAGHDAISVRTDFEGGNIQQVEQLSPTHIQCAVRGETDQDGRNQQPSWFYFRIDGARRRELTIDLTGFRGEYNYKPTDGLWAGKLKPAISFDNKHWEFVQETEFDPSIPRLRMKVKAPGDQVWLARIPPYVGSDLARLLQGFRGHAALQEESAGVTPQGRPIPLLTITDPSVAMAGKKVIWLMTRQHSWEAGTSWVGEGAIRYLLSEEAAPLRRQFVFRIFPLCDPDGVARGGVRFNASGYDLNRNWDTPDHSGLPEISAERRAMKKWLEAGNRIDLFLTIHNTESQDYIEGPLVAGGTEAAAVLRRIHEGLSTRTAFHSPGGPRDMKQTTTAGMKGRMTVNQSLFHDHGTLAMLMELMTERSPKLQREPSVQDRLDFGAALVQVLTSSLSR